jgi:hypothetical protein
MDLLHAAKSTFAKEFPMTPMNPMRPLRQRMIEDMQIRNLALNTQKSYVEQVARFAGHFHASPDRLGLCAPRKKQT